MTEREKIINVLNKNFTQDVECTPVYTTADGKEIELPQELCDIFNDIVTQAVIPYFADALIEAGIGDVRKRPIDPTYEEYATQVHNLAIEEQKQRARAEEAEHRAEVAERALREFAAQVGCRSCPYRGLCGISNPSAENDYQECYEAALRITEKELAEGKDD